VALASIDEPLKLADGTLVYTDGTLVDPNEQPRMVEVPTNAQAQQLVVNARRKLSDLPDVPRTMNAISAVLSYTLFGLSDEEIAVTLNVTMDQIARIKLLDGYTMMYDTVIRSVLDAEGDDIRKLISQHQRTAVARVVATMDKGKSELNRLNAARDILDRGGNRPIDVVEHRHRLEGGLTIEIIRKDETKHAPTIDMEIPQ
jgi:ABC-type proline/glycine betaine transport system ATPase subunit